MTKKEQQDFLSGKDEVELTDELISQIIKDELWGDAQSLRNMRERGAKWNAKRNSVVFPNESF